GASRQSLRMSRTSRLNRRTGRLLDGGPHIVTVTEQPASFGQRSFSPALEAECLHQEAGTVELLFTPRRFALLLGLLLCAAYPDVLFGERTFFYRDFGIFGYPLAHYHRECFWRGEVP